MFTNRSRLSAGGVLAVSALLSGPARGEALHLAYEANWGGLHVADFTLSLDQRDGVYENRLRLETRGVTRYFSNFSMTAEGQGRIDAHPASHVAGHYRTEYLNAKHFRWLDIVFTPATLPAQSKTGTQPLPDRPDAWNPRDKGPETLDDVPEAERIGVLDPLALVSEMRLKVREHFAGGPSTWVLKGFDGRRRFDMTLAYLGPATRTIGERVRETYRVRVTPTPLAGFKKRHEEIWKSSPYDFYLSRDGAFVPLQIAPVNHGPVLTLTDICPTECELRDEETN
ncbi:MAG: DUF3108 domain-containing protein [Alphaproteobacteria bacterium]|nr:DUF3108 domain-containing protein [Alphaproteobacteria bacterium]